MTYSKNQWYLIFSFSAYIFMAGCSTPSQVNAQNSKEILEQDKSDEKWIKEYYVYSDGMFKKVEIDNSDELDKTMKGCLRKSPKMIRYPAEARQKSISGAVRVEVIVNAFGLLESTKVLQGIGYGCDEEAERFIRSAFANCPIIAKVNDVPMKAKFTYPISFNLE